MKNDPKISLKALEEYGMDNRFLTRIGLAIHSDGGIRIKQSVKIYIPKYSVELYQTIAIYFKLKETTVSNWVRGILENEAKKLIASKDPLFQEAMTLHKELREHQYLKLIEESEKK
jgi:hypothetical protein